MHNMRSHGYMHNDVCLPPVSDKHKLHEKNSSRNRDHYNNILFYISSVGSVLCRRKMAGRKRVHTHTYCIGCRCFRQMTFHNHECHKSKKKKCIIWYIKQQNVTFSSGCIYSLLVCKWFAASRWRSFSSIKNKYNSSSKIFSFIAYIWNQIE